MAIAVTIATNTALDASNEEAVLSITFTNTTELDYAANSNLVYTCLLTDNATTPNTRTVMFAVAKTTAGTLEASYNQPFTFDNSTGLTGTITGSEAKLYYTPQ